MGTPLKGTAPPFLKMPASSGVPWAQLLGGVQAVMDGNGYLAGSWGECLTAALLYEIENPKWEKDPRFKDDGPVGQVLDALEQQGFGKSIFKAGEKLEDDTKKALKKGKPVPIFQPGLGGPAPAAGPDITVGAQMAICGLEKKPELNGTLCTVLSWDRDVGKWVIELPAGQKARLGVENLTHPTGRAASAAGASEHESRLRAALGLPPQANLREVLQLPADWDMAAFVQGKILHGKTGGRQDTAVVAFQEMTQLFPEVQKLLDATYRKVYTRDRRGAPIPDRFVVKSVLRVMNDQVWREYASHCAKIRERIGAQSNELLGTLETNQAANQGAAHAKLPPLDETVHEAWLFHGTSKDAAQGIAENDFRLDLTGTNAGTLYGKGIYLAENASGADNQCCETHYVLSGAAVCSLQLQASQGQTSIEFHAAHQGTRS